MEDDVKIIEKTWQMLFPPSSHKFNEGDYFFYKSQNRGAYRGYFILVGQIKKVFKDEERTIFKFQTLYDSTTTTRTGHMDQFVYNSAVYGGAKVIPEGGIELFELLYGT